MSRRTIRPVRVMTAAAVLALLCGVPLGVHSARSEIQMSTSAVNNADATRSGNRKQGSRYLLTQPRHSAKASKVDALPAKNKFQESSSPKRSGKQPRR